MPVLFRCCLALVVVVLLGGCGGDTNDTPSEVTGRIVAIQQGDSSIESFTLETDDRTYEIGISDSVNYGFDLRHLEVHRQTGQPVRARLRQRGDRLFALSIVDA